MKKCEGAPWCLLDVADGQHACKLHTELPALTLRSSETGLLIMIEDADKWYTRYRRFKKAQAAAKQAESDAEMEKRR